VALGIYDYVGNFGNVNNMTYDMYFVSWLDTSGLTLLIQNSALRGRIPIITMEPDNSSSSNFNSWLGDVWLGVYDQDIDNFCAAVNAANTPVIIRYMQEMDLGSNIGRYPWAQPVSLSKNVIDDFNYIGNRMRSELTVPYQIMWSPGGDPNASYYYPGNANCDLIGCSVYDWTAVGWGTGTFVGDFGPIYAELSPYGKPIFVAELGVINSENQGAFLAGAIAAAPNYPLVQALIYFNAIDPTSVNGVRPNWAITPAIW
jgi:beta-mannanase